MISKSIQYGNDAILVSLLLLLLQFFIKSLYDVLLILHDLLDAIEHQLEKIKGKEQHDDDVFYDSSSYGEPIPIFFDDDDSSDGDDVPTTPDLIKSDVITYDKKQHRPSVVLSSDVVNHLILDLWVDDNVEPTMNLVAKILNRDLWLTNDEWYICDLLEKLIIIETSTFDFVSFGGLTVIIIIMNQFKTNEYIIYQCCKLMTYLTEEEHDDIDLLIPCLSYDTRYMRCIVQCLNQFPMNIDIQIYCFRILDMMTWNNKRGATLLIDVYKCNSNFHNNNNTVSGFQSVLLAMKEFTSHRIIQEKGCCIIKNIACKEYRKTILEHSAGVIGILASALETCEIDEAKSTIQRLLDNNN